MKRAAPIFPMVLLLSLLMPLFPGSAIAESIKTAEVLAWVNGLRGQWRQTELGRDPLLEQTAAAYAAYLGERGVLSHVDDAGRRALQRFQARGGTTVLVGELLGSGEALPSVSAAWEASPSHREVVLNPLWTHCGAASVESPGAVVWVVLFTSHRIYPLQIRRAADGYLIRGRLVSVQNAEPFLLSGIERIDYLHWDSRSGEFSFFVPMDREGIYHRLGYSSRDGGVVVTNAFYPHTVVKIESVTSGRERESR